VFSSPSYFSNWKDKLTGFNGTSLTYDAIGNMLKHYTGFTFEWQNGRQLAGVTGNNQTISYTYNADGIRTSKTVNGVTTYYTLEGSNVVMETDGTDTIWYYYDATGSLTGFELNGTAYFYVKNLQGDIIAITDASGTKVVEYAYDAWGRVRSTTGSLASTVGAKNPYRYRGYRYEKEFGLYYLQSRYYDPFLKRFINADGYASTGQGVLGNNIFAYCGNNPANRADASGAFWHTATLDFAFEACNSDLRSGFLPQPTSEIGAAPDYESVLGGFDSPNCYGFALGSDTAMNPGDASGKYPKNWGSVSDVGSSVKADLIAKGYTVREISGPDSKLYENEYRIALRVGTNPYIKYYMFCAGTYYEQYDYHFMVQTSTGQWAEKYGTGGDSILWDYGMTPDTIPWILYGEPYYDSQIYYFAIGYPENNS